MLFLYNDSEKQSFYTHTQAHINEQLQTIIHAIVYDTEKGMTKRAAENVKAAVSS